jgi:dienelactone hydrolase
MFLAVFLPLNGCAGEIDSGRETAIIQGVSMTVFTYRPPNCTRPGLLFVFHGNGRTAARYRDYARPLADRACLVVMAPLFDKGRFSSRRYHRGGIVRKGRVRPRDQWTVTMVAGLVDWGRRREGRPDMPYYLFGHSAGGQFLSRVAAFAPPPGVARIVIANSSSHVAASLDEPAPYGMGDVFEVTEAEARLQTYLNLPVTIYLGEEDTGSKDLHNNRAARRQGSQRLERGESVFQAAQNLAREKGWAFNWKLVKVSNVGHSARLMLKAAQAPEAFGWSKMDKRR